MIYRKLGLSFKTVKKHYIIKCIYCYLIVIPFMVSCTSTETFNNLTFYPEHNEKGINPDTHLKITFDSKPIIGNIGKIRVFDSKTNALVDVLDMSVPAGPTEKKQKSGSNLHQGILRICSG